MIYSENMHQYGPSLRHTRPHLRGASSEPKTVRGRTTVTPGLSMGTSIMLCCWWVLAVWSVLPMNMHNLQRGSFAPVRFTHVG